MRASTITDKSYWPSEARQSAKSIPLVRKRDLNFCVAYDREPSHLQPAMNPNESGSAWRYQGGRNPGNVRIGAMR